MIRKKPRGPSAPKDHPSANETAGSLLAVLSSLVWLGVAAVIARVFGDLMADQPVEVWRTGLWIVLLWGLRATLDMAAQGMLARAADARIAVLRHEIVTAEAQAATPSALGGAGAIAALTHEKLEALRPALLRYRPARMRVMVLPPVILCIAAWHSWAVALVLLLAGPLIPVFMALVGWAAKEASARQLQEVGQLSDLLVERLAALSDLRLIGAGPATVDSFAQASDDLRVRTMAVLRIAFLSSTVLEFFSAVGVAMVAIWVGFSLLGELSWGGWGDVLKPTVGLYLLLLAPEFFRPLRDLAAAWHDKSGADAVMDEVATWRAEMRPRRLGRGEAVSPCPMTTLETRGLGHRGVVYPDIRLEPGDSLAIEGPSGSGKTTLLRLIAGVERPAEGLILIGGVPLSDETADAWRAGIGWMPQAPHFVNGSLRHNIGFGAAVTKETLEAARLTDVIDLLLRGDLTRLGERGAGLSGGEARRVTLARAMHGNPGLLMADEPTADLDPETAQLVSDSLLRFADAGGTLVVSTHDTALAARMAQRITIDRSAAA
ncbi:cysteine ABC transporter permease [Meridianimarinicoccus roseus]|uniref:Cysteine ABC transporter permease n=1 Tax=Meridianimarinicoccus roseus TaxID=2072018 RepID=A0A2V2LFN5_9RHOB|nr:ATP-binding cassette domain-containing protein [Meridianimarinicoccus roseus]PWR02046.1 cysteine ABC transporter permease [Meridianimarinicoccus roseus]